MSQPDLDPLQGLGTYVVAGIILVLAIACVIVLVIRWLS